MNDATPARPKPVALRTKDERYAHVVLRLKERGGIDWTPEKVGWLEGRIKFCRQQLNLHKSVALILPKKIAETKGGQIHHYRCLVSGNPHTFIWSQIARGIISYIGPGEILPAPEPAVEAAPAP